MQIRAAGRAGGGFGALLLGGAAAIWGTLYVAADWLMRRIPPFGLLEIRFLIGGAVLFLIAQRRGELGRLQSGEAGRYALLGLVGFLGSIGLQFLGTDLAGAASGSLITAASPALIALFALGLLGEPLTSRRVLGLVLGLLGIAAVVGWPSGTRSLPGDLLLAGAAITWALYTVYARRATRSASSLRVTAWASLFGAAFTLPPALAEYLVHPWRMPVGAGEWGLILYVGTVCTAGGFYLWNKGFEYLPAASGGLLLLVQPVVGGLLGAWLLGEQIGAGFLLGAGLIALSLLTALAPERGGRRVRSSPRSAG